ncbi:MAG: PAS domain-containing protein [Rhizomicrobium sp.]
MKHRNLHLIVGYWSRLRQGRALPDQTDLEPRAIKRLLPYTFILDCENPLRPVYRLAGTSLCERYGFELKGTGFLSHWDPQSAPALATLLSQSLKFKQPVSLTSIGVTHASGMVEMERVMAPLCFRSDKPTRFLGLVQLLSDPAPFFGRAIAHERLIGSQLVREDERHYDPPPRVTLRSHPKAPYLGLVID